MKHCELTMQLLTVPREQAVREGTAAITEPEENKIWPFQVFSYVAVTSDP